MEKRYSAFGLALRAAFPLPGMPEDEAGGGLPLSLVLRTPGQLQEVWSGARARESWRGRLGDGNDLTIEWGSAGDLRFEYGGGARFLLDPDRARLACAPQDPAALEWKRVLLSRILPNASLARGSEALHACAVETPGGVVAIAAPSGAGKSTLAAELMRRGAALFADDVLILRREGDAILAHPGSPHANLTPGPSGSAEPERLGAVLASFAGERWVAVRRASREPRPVTAIVLLERGGDLALAVEAIAPSPLALAAHMLGLPDDEPGREASRFALYSDLVESTSILRLTGGAADGPAELADALERALALAGPRPERAVA